MATQTAITAQEIIEYKKLLKKAKGSVSFAQSNYNPDKERFIELHDKVQMWKSGSIKARFENEYFQYAHFPV